ncbi:hypothetical protein U1Q18_009249 [Sarracenia purpurea var. burkii]
MLLLCHQPQMTFITFFGLQIVQIFKFFSSNYRSIPCSSFFFSCFLSSPSSAPLSPPVGSPISPIFPHQSSFAPISTSPCQSSFVSPFSAAHHTTAILAAAIPSAASSPTPTAPTLIPNPHPNTPIPIPTATTSLAGIPLAAIPAPIADIPIRGITIDLPIPNAHPMLTRSKTRMASTALTANVSNTTFDISEPKSHKEAIHSPKWFAAMKDDFFALLTHQTW